jgi:S1-C subfamily serine protease
MRFSTILKTVLLLVLCIIFSCPYVSPNTSILNETISQKASGELEQAYEQCKEALKKHPKNKKIIANYSAIKKELIANYYLEASAVSEYDLPQKRLIAQKIINIDSNQNGLLLQISKEIESINNKVSATSAETDVISLLNTYQSLVSYEPYFGTVRLLKNRLIDSRPEFINKIREFQRGGKEDQAILISHLLSLSIPNSAEFIKTRNELLLARAESALSLSKQYYEVENQERIATSLIYAIIAWNYGKRDAQLKETIRVRLNEIVIKGEKSLAILFLNNFSDRQKSALFENIKEADQAKKNVSIYEVKASNQPQPGSVLLELDLTDLSIDENQIRSSPYSKYLSGYQEVRNPEYDNLAFQYQQALLFYQEASKKPDFDERTGRLNSEKIAASTQLVILSNKLKKVPRFLKQEVFQDYQYDKVDINYHLNMNIKYRLMDPAAQLMMTEGAYERSSDERRVVIAGAHPQDATRIKDSSISADEKNIILKTFSDNNYASLVKMIITDLVDRIDVFEALAALGNKNYGQAIDKYFLYKILGLLSHSPNILNAQIDDAINELCTKIGIVSVDHYLGKLKLSDLSSADMSLSRIFNDSFMNNNFLGTDYLDFNSAFKNFDPDNFAYLQDRTPSKTNIKLASSRKLKEAGGNISAAVIRRGYIEECLSSVVIIETPKGTGSGFVINAKGYVITNYHVVAGQEEIRVRLNDGRTVYADIISLIKFKDLALLKINAQNVKAMVLGDLKFMKSGDVVYALGAPGGLKNQVLDQTVTRGIISAIRLLEAPYNPSEKIQFIQTDAAINPGNSGGPLINEKGEVIGVNSQKIVREAVEGLNFAISIEEVKKSFSEYLR